MKYYISFFLVIHCYCCIEAQSFSRPVLRESEKRPLDTSIFTNWPSVGSPAINPDGHYALYWKEGSKGVPELVIQVIDGSWKKEVPGGSGAMFTDDSRALICMQPGDSLCLITLGSAAREYICPVQSFELFEQAGAQWLAYQMSAADKKLVFRELSAGKEQSFSGVRGYVISQDGKVVLLSRVSKKDNVISQTVDWINLLDGRSKTLWSSGPQLSAEQGNHVDNLVLDSAGVQAAFRVQEKVSNGQEEKSFWHYKAGIDQAIALVNSETPGMDSDLELAGISKFSLDGRRLFISLREKAREPAKPGIVAVDVWSYQDTVLQSEQLSNLGGVKTYDAVIFLRDRHVLRLQQQGEHVSATSKFSDDYMVMDARIGNKEEQHWSNGSRPSCYVVSTRTGERQHLNFEAEDMSADGKYVTGRDQNGEFFSYEIATGKSNSISSMIPVAPLYIYEQTLLPTRGIQLAGWLTDNKTMLLVHDAFDIWEVDPSGKLPAVNVTHGFGRSNNIELRLADKYDYEVNGKAIVKGQSIILRAFNKFSKDQGFYRQVLGGREDPERLIMGPYDYKVLDDRNPIKAREADLWLVRRGSAQESPNYFWTNDFKTMNPVSAEYPEKQYNWLRTELVSFKTVDGRINQGVIYKPENFNPEKKYPVIITYYEQRSDNLNTYLGLTGDGHNFSVPWFVSHGYVVFMPDIHYKKGNDGRSALNAILGASTYLGGLSWADGRHIGVIGFSFGGFETNYIVTHTDRFAAAISICGMSDVISDYGNLWSRTYSRQSYYENRGGRMGATLWERPDLYIENSPIFHVDKITIPLLTVANKADGNVPFEQGLELFLALRRLGKRGWMLQYDGQSHGLGGGRAFIDFTIRSQQFFDHYLRGAPSPKWMVEGIAAGRKGFEDGLELEAGGVEPGPGLLMQASEKK